MAEPTPFVSVIIPVLNRRGVIGACLDALGRQTYPRDRYEVIVVDNGSTDGTIAEIERYPTVRLLKEPRRSSYAARNRGIAGATGETIAFTDSDCLPDPAWITEGVSCLESDPRLGLVAGRVALFVADPSRPTLAELYELCFSFAQEQYIEVSQFGATANVFTRAAVLRQVGVFDGQLESLGDSEWGRRVAKGGWGQKYCDAAVVRHPARATWRDLEDRMRRMFRGRRALGVTLSWWEWLRTFPGTAKDLYRVLVSRAVEPRWKPKAMVAAVRMRLLLQRLRFALIR